MGLTVVDHMPGMIIGRGFDDLTGEPKFSAAVTAESGVPPGQGGARGTFDFININTRSDFEQAIDFSTSASAGLGGFGASFKAQYMEKCKISKEATFCMIRFNVTNPVRVFLGTPKLTDEANELLELNKMERFRQRFGTKCVAGIETGAEFFATVRIESQDKSNQSTIRAEMEAKFGAFAADMSAGFEGISTSSTDKIAINVFQVGGLIKPVFNLPAVMELAVTAAEQGQGEQAFPNRAVLTDYEDFELPNDDVSFINLQHQRESVKSMGDSYRELQVLLNDIEYVLRNQSFFRNPKIGALNQAAQKISEEMNKLVAAADKCLRKPDQCELVTPVIPPIPLPERKPTTTRGSVKVTEGLLPDSPIGLKLKTQVAQADIGPGKKITGEQLAEIAQVAMFNFNPP